MHAFRALDPVVLTEDLPEHGLTRGAVGAVVHVHDEGSAYEVEFVSDAGETTAVLTLGPDRLRPMRRGDPGPA